MTKCLFCMMFCFIVMATGGAVAEAQSLQPDGWDAGLKLVEAADVNPDPQDCRGHARGAHLVAGDRAWRAHRRVDVQRRSARTVDSRSCAAIV